MLYWPVAAADSVQAKEAELQTLDNRYFKLNARTVDQVFPGEQQPENDHVFTSENAESGVFRNIHWRSASGYFSYRMRINPAVKSIGVTYYGKETNRDFDIFINDVKIAHVVLANTGNDDFVDAEYPVPAALTTGGRDVIVKFVATRGYKTAEIYDVRLLRK